MLVQERAHARAQAKHRPRARKYVQEAAARAFVNLSYEGDGARAIVQAGQIPPIAELLSSPRRQVQQEAIWVVVNLSVLPENESGETAPLL